MGWRRAAKHRRSNAQHNVSVLHDAAQAHLTRLLSAHGVAVTEHPLAVDRTGVTRGATHLWRSDNLLGLAPTFEALRYADYWPLTIFDVVTASPDGVLLAAFEVAAFAPPSSRKRALLRSLALPVWSISANDALNMTPECPWLAVAFRTDRKSRLAAHPLRSPKAR